MSAIKAIGEPENDDGRDARPEKPINSESAETYSPVCFAENADPAYMGYLSREDLIAFLNTMLEAERAGAIVTRKSAQETSVPAMKSLLDSVHHDEVRWCVLLLRGIRELGGEPSPKTGGFYEKAMAIEDMRERLTFLNRGQEWVVRKLKEALPKIRDDSLHRGLSAMLISHEDNISLTAAFLDGHPQRDAS